MTVTEKEFEAVAYAALRFFDGGLTETAFVLDDLARKMNRELANKATLPARRFGPMNGREPWRVESPLEAAGLRKSKEAKPTK